MTHSIIVRASRVLAAFLVLVAFMKSAPAQQCSDWREGPLNDVIRGANGPVYAAALWDPDWIGPMPAWLVVGGDFTEIGGVAANYIAAFDGQRWRPLGAGTSGPVYAVTGFLGDLYAGGHFAFAGGVLANNIAKWTGGVAGSWQAMGSGLDDPGNVSDESVYALAVYNTEVIAGGSFFFLGAHGFDSGVARWSNGAWRSLGDGLGQVGNGSFLVQVSVRALQVYNSELVVGGGFALEQAGPPVNIARWNGTTWQGLGSGIQSGWFWPVFTMNVYGADLIVGGTFFNAGGVAASNIAAWNGSGWRALGSGIGSYAPYTLGVYQSRLFAGGYFNAAGGVSVNSIAAWDGVQWSPLAEGLNRPNGAAASCMTVYNNALVVGGTFDTAGTTPANNLATWDLSSWSAPEGSANVSAMAVHNGWMVAAGDFAAPNTLGGVAKNIAVWDGVEVNGLGTGTNAPVRALKSYAAGSGPLQSLNLIAGGEFTAAGGIAANRIAAWSQTAFTPGSWSAMGPGFNATVRAIERFNGSTYAAGDFTASGASPLNHIARFDGANWQPVGPNAVTGVNGTARAMKATSSGVTNINLIVGGDFTSAGGVAANHIASYNASTIRSEEHTSELQS